MGITIPSYVAVIALILGIIGMILTGFLAPSNPDAFGSLSPPYGKVFLGFLLIASFGLIVIVCNISDSHETESSGPD